MLVSEALEAGFSTTAVVHDEAGDDLVDQERVPAVEKKVKLSPLGGLLRGRSEARREPGRHDSPAEDPAWNVPAIRAARSRSGKSAIGEVHPNLAATSSPRKAWDALPST